MPSVKVRVISDHFIIIIIIVMNMHFNMNMKKQELLYSAHIHPTNAHGAGGIHPNALTLKENRLKLFL
jgi:hypothetical protein